MSLYVSVFNFFMNHESKQTNPLRSYVLCSDSSRGRISCSSCSLTRERERGRREKEREGEEEVFSCCATIFILSINTIQNKQISYSRVLCSVSTQCSISCSSCRPEQESKKRSSYEVSLKLLGNTDIGFEMNNVLL